MTRAGVRLGLRANAQQFSLLVAVNGLVGAMLGLERTVLPLIGERDFGLSSQTAILSFVLAFGVAKAPANLLAGRLADGVGRKRLLVLGWLLALPVPPLVAYAPSWSWIVAANLLLGASQGVAWSLTVLMKIDLAGPARRGLALGMNETAGYLGVAAAAFATGALAAVYAPRAVVAAGGAAIALVGLAASVLLVRDTRAHARAEQELERGTEESPAVVRACAQAGFVNNLNDAAVWGLVPLYLAAAGASLTEIGLVAAVYPAVWGIGQIGAGWMSDSAGRKPLIAVGMLLQATALAILAASRGSFVPALAAAVVLGAGTALVYPTLIAAVSDAVSTRERPRAVGAYRFWRDSGFIAGALLAGLAADAVGAGVAFALVAALTGASGAWVIVTRWNFASRDASHRDLGVERGLKTP